MPGFSVRAPVDTPQAPTTGPYQINSSCHAGEIIFAQGQTRFSQLDPSGGWGWEIGPVPVQTNEQDCIIAPLWAGM